MSVELRMLAWAIVLGLVQVTLAATLATAQRGFAWGAGARDGDPKPLTPLAARMVRASANFLETFPFFAAAVLVLAVLGRSTAQTVLGAQLYFWARVLYVPAYAAGVPMVRTLVWAAAMAGLVMVLLGVF
jgi:uncharacterized MAPEG superfamily protein